MGGRSSGLSGFLRSGVHGWKSGREYMEWKRDVVTLTHTVDETLEQGDKCDFPFVRIVKPAGQVKEISHNFQKARVRHLIFEMAFGFMYERFKDELSYLSPVCGIQPSFMNGELTGVQFIQSYNLEINSCGKCFENAAVAAAAPQRLYPVTF